MKETPQLTPNWDLLADSIRLLGNHIFSIFWLVIIPAVVSGVGGYQIELAIREIAGSGTVTLDTYATVFQNSDAAQLGMTLTVISTLWVLLATPAVIVMSARGVRGVGDELFAFLREGFRYAWRLYGLIILLSTIVVLGLLALIVPGLILLRRYVLAPYYLVERDTGILEAMKLSARQSKPERASVWGALGVIVVVMLAASFINTFGLIGVIIGVLMNTMYFFLLPLRQKEISDIHHYNASAKPAARKSN